MIFSQCLNNSLLISFNEDLPNLMIARGDKESEAHISFSGNL